MKTALKTILFGTIATAIYFGVLYSIQNSLLFYPNKHYISPLDISLPEFSEEILTAEDNTPIMMWYHQGEADKPAILFVHGNAGQIATFAPHLLPIAKAGYSVLMIEYRGFGNTEGYISQKITSQDVALAFDWLKAKGYSKIIVYGYSFGTAFSSALTDLRTIDGLILTAPFSSLYKLVSEKPVPLARFALKDKYMSVDYLKKYSAPLLIIHGKKDRLIPYHHAQILYDAAISKDKKIKLIEEDNHNSIFFDEANIPYILEFLQKFQPESVDINRSDDN